MQRSSRPLHIGPTARMLNLRAKAAIRVRIRQRTSALAAQPFLTIVSPLEETT